MFFHIYTKFRQGVRQHGLVYFLQLQVTELIYRYKFKKLSLEYAEGKIPAEVINRISSNNDSKINSASPFHEILKAFTIIGIKYPDICLLDIGCGYGKVLNLGMLLNFKKVIGIDLDNSAVVKAINNCNQMKKNGYPTKYNVFQNDASQYSVPEEVNLIYLFNPFGKKTMEDVVKNIISHHHMHNKELYVIYSIPVHQELLTEHKEVAKIYERLNGTKTKSEMAIFRISSN